MTYPFKKSAMMDKKVLEDCNIDYRKNIKELEEEIKRIQKNISANESLIERIERLVNE